VIIVAVVVVVVDYIMEMEEKKNDGPCKK